LQNPRDGDIPLSFARTKIQPPRQRPGSIARPALEAYVREIDRAD